MASGVIKTFSLWKIDINDEDSFEPTGTRTPISYSIGLNGCTTDCDPSTWGYPISTII